MNYQTDPAIQLAFSEKYDNTHAEQYFRKHQDGLARRLSHQRDVQLTQQALHLAGEPREILDLPCGAGRFWPTLMANPERKLVAADNSTAMLEVARQAHPYLGPDRLQMLQTSAFAIALPDAAVDCIFCYRLMHHIQQPEHRLAMLREFHRVTRDTLIVSLWVDGNYKAWRRTRLEKKRPGRSDPNRVVIPARQFESEFAASGFTQIDKLDFLPLYAMWRVYVLRKTTSGKV